MGGGGVGNGSGGALIAKGCLHHELISIADPTDAAAGLLLGPLHISAHFNDRANQLTSACLLTHCQQEKD